MTWELSATSIEGCFLVRNPLFADSRGSFSETYKKSLFKTLGLPEMSQDNHLVTKRGGIRAMHWQDGEYSQSKLINVVVGEIFDAVYDLRKDSPTYQSLATFDLNDSSPMLFVPAGCAHGFQSVSDSSIVHYKTDKEYDPKSQRAFAWNDPSVQINWPVKDALLSEKDAQAPLLSEYLQNE